MPKNKTTLKNLEETAACVTRLRHPSQPRLSVVRLPAGYCVAHIENGQLVTDVDPMPKSQLFAYLDGMVDGLLTAGARRD